MPDSDEQQNDQRLLGGWVRHMRTLAPGVSRADLESAGLGLLQRYAQPHRAYHDGRHLGEVLTAVALLAENADDLSAVVAAAWWHDAVYDVTAAPGDNEEASAQLADQTLSGWGVEPARVARVAALVRMTTTHEPPAGDRDAAVLSDADLAVLAAGPERYGQYAAGIRDEYQHIPDDVFAAGRGALLRTLLAQDQIYRTAQANERWEQLARVNLEAELASLA